jgi:hypothetical protein
VPQLPAGVEGTWSLWRISMNTVRGEQQRFMPLFVQNGRAFAPTARRLWDLLIGEDLVIDEDLAPPVTAETSELAEAHAEQVYLELKDTHLRNLSQERQRVEAAFDARRRAIGRIGLENVRRSRLRRLEEDQQARLRQLAAAEHVMPSLEPVLIVQIRAE